MTAVIGKLPRKSRKGGSHDRPPPFTTLLVGGIAAPGASLAQTAKSKNVFYASVGPELTRYSVDVDNATLVKSETVSTPVNIQYAWPHPSRKYLYVVGRDGHAAVAATAPNGIQVGGLPVIDLSSRLIRP